MFRVKAEYRMADHLCHRHQERVVDEQGVIAGGELGA